MYKASFSDKNCFYLIMEYASEGDLESFINKNKKLNIKLSQSEIIDLFV